MLLKPAVMVLDSSYSLVPLSSTTDDDRSGYALNRLGGH